MKYEKYIIQEQCAPFADFDVEELATIHDRTGLKLMPHWVAQPYFRPLPSVRSAVATPVESEAPKKTVAQPIEVAAA
jgi:hypothetical protein